MSSERVHVAVRLRTLISDEEKKSGVAWKVNDEDGVEELADAMSPAASSNKSSFISTPKERAMSFQGPTPFVYDHTFGQSVPTKQIYEDAFRFIIEGALDGFNGTIFAYGQTGSGKTYTMIGTPESPGIVVLALNDIFKDFTSQKRHASKRFLIRCSFLEIYNETINDLLDPSKKNLKLQDTGTEINVVGLTCSQVTSVDDALHLMEDGLKGRKTASTKMNDHSSRSHSIFTIYIEALDSKSGSVKQAQLNLVDLAGSESAKRSGTSGKRLQEGEDCILTRRTLCPDGNMMFHLFSIAQELQLIPVYYHWEMRSQCFQKCQSREATQPTHRLRLRAVGMALVVSAKDLLGLRAVGMALVVSAEELRLPHVDGETVPCTSRT